MNVSVLLRTNTNNVYIQLFRYTIVGGIAFIVDFVSLFILTEFIHFHYLISAAIAFSLGLTTNYILSISWVFDARSLQNKYKELVIFTIIGIIGLLFNELFMWYFTEIILFHYLM